MVTSERWIKIFGITIVYYRKSRPITPFTREYSDLVDIWEN